LICVRAIASESLYSYDSLYFDKGKGMPMQAEAVISSKGQVTLPAAMRAKLGLKSGSHIHFELRGQELVIKPELPMSAYRGILKGYDLGNIEPEKEADRAFE
jgi:AbrB family looped-hinge helix DNA binding protein